MTKKLDGCVALVTGGVRGIGLGAVRALAAQGAKVWMTDLAEVESDAVASALAEVDGTAQYQRLDVTDEASWADAIARVQAEDDRLDILVNNAGIDGTGRIQDMTLDLWRKVQAVNTDGAFLGVKTAFELMNRSGKLREGGAAIVNVSSVMGFVAFPESAAYCASKGAIRTFTKACAVEFAAYDVPIRANSVHPGFVQTPLVDEGFERLVARGMAKSVQTLKDQIADMTPVKRLAHIDEIAKAIVFLVSEDASYMTGSEMVVDGGYLAR
ncbi:SDR family oxidoreductase [Sphingobium sp. DEHP117]|uniref:SDR family NAD(P)-dependent oxidoreductase n=1 Tax=Sphingobium sp. DEHP117 TaxID=2993436 RepID=UPI0027D596A2|nr:SDR family oxidoreductase [Sphingobium sp. DEHP117]MDQ4421549.1 SDR family oxidoreductase [Sphingobium sp. DEHP117]